MAKNLKYVCSACGAVFAKWAGRCDACGSWNSLSEQLDAVKGEAASAKRGRPLSSTAVGKVNAVAKDHRTASGIGEVDQVLGGGIVRASVILVSGEPGIGKSTLLTQLAHGIAKHGSVLYVSAEESLEQISARAKRLGATAPNFNLASSTSTDDIVATMHSEKLELVIVDSIQTIASDLTGTSAGSPSQISQSAQLLIRAAKLTDTALVLVGHVTKEGNIAGPKLLEHLVDVVLNLEGDRYGGFKLLRGIKNRYGSTNETGVFEMTEKGLSEVANPSEVLLRERQISDGSIVLATMEGSRPLLVEVQALVNKTAFGYPKRAASGFDIARLNLLCAMISRRTKLDLGDKDVYINVVGGIAIREPAADLAVCMAVASAAKGMSLKTDAVVFGEVGLSGEIRSVAMTTARIKEAKKLGFKAAIAPKQPKRDNYMHEVSSLKDALNQFLSKN